MKDNTFTPRFLFISVLVILAVATRLMPHPPNFAPITAIALFGGAYFADKKMAFLVPMFAMFLSDLVLGLHSWMFAVYGSFIVIVLLGYLLRDKLSVVRLALVTIGASTTFFVLTNLAVWALSGFYAFSVAGLIECYTMAIPFYHYSLLGDIVYVGVMFGAFELAKYKLPQMVTVDVKS